MYLERVRVGYSYFVRFISIAVVAAASFSARTVSLEAWDNPNQSLNIASEPYSWGGVSTTDASGNTYQVVPFKGTFTTGNISVSAPAGSDRWAIAKYDSSGSPVWVSLPANASIPIAAIKVDTAGNVYMSGDYWVEATLGTSTLPTPVENDAWVGKMNSAGTMLWARPIGGTGKQWAPGVGVDSSGNVYVSGGFQNTTSFGSAGNLLSKGDYDIFLAKLNSTGTFQWVTSVGDTGDDNAGWMNNLYVDGAGNSYVTGQIQGSVTVGSTTLTSNGGLDNFVGKVNASGQWQWVTSGGSAASDNTFGVGVDSSNNVFITGQVSGAATYGEHSTTHSGQPDVLLAKLNSSGVWQWAKTFGGSGEEGGSALTVDSSGNPIITGYFNSAAFQIGGTTFQFGGDWDGFVAKWKGDGTFQWAKHIDGLKDDEFYGIGTDASDNIYLSGYLTGPASVSLGGAAAIDLVDACTIDCSRAALWRLTASGSSVYSPPVSSTTSTSTSTTTIVTTTTTPVVTTTTLLTTTMPTTSTSITNTVSSTPVSTFPVSQSIIPKVENTPTSRAQTTSKKITSNTSKVLEQVEEKSIPESQTSASPRAVEVQTGAFTAVINGKESSTTVRRESNQMILSVDTMVLKIAAINDEGERLPLDSTGSVTFSDTDSIDISVSGIQGKSEFKTWLFPEAQVVSVLPVSLLGEANASVPFPSSITDGSHTLTFEATTSTGESAELRLGVSVDNVGGSSNTLTTLLVTILILAVLAAIVMPAVIRRNKSKIKP